ncbi:MAG: MotA/TolQ/ExbB proton channel family protein [Myxococcales bacterium]|nr:MotA/TolQ/ExbB proton channel family protein [Myxococcales bacterium]
MGFIESGGYVMPPLVASALVLWYALGDRALRLRPGHIVPRARDRALAVTRRGGPDLEPRVEAALGDLRAELRRGRTVVRAVVMVAPLAGLLGTVAGMIETFDGLGDSALFSRTGGVAGGISQALLTTQMGLVVAVPGVIAGRLLDRRQRSLDAELIRIRALAVVGDLA